MILASTWRPRGELHRLQKLLPRLKEVYESIVVALPPGSDDTVLSALEDVGLEFLGENGKQKLFILETVDWSWGRHVALQKAVDVSLSHIQYADLDRLLRWIETRPGEWERTVKSIEQCDCLIIGRTDAAYNTHPRALLRTEVISNSVTSYLLGKTVDVSAGSKGFSHRAGEYLIANSTPGHALGTDSEWPILLHQAGFKIEYVVVDGLDWEIPDQYLSEAANAERQHHVAEEYDADPDNWARRVEVALEIVQSGIETIKRIPDDDIRNFR